MTSTQSLRRRNPYVGPRPLRTDEVLYARGRETREVADTLIAEGTVILHSPSGAGKTSLIQAGVIPLLQHEGLHPLPPLRVGATPPTSVRNRYVHSVAARLLGDPRDAGDLTDISLVDALDRALRAASGGSAVLIFDQFEEIVTSDPTDLDAKAVFFRELVQVISQGRVRALFSLREEYLGWLHKYLPLRTWARFRIDFLSHADAVAAIKSPAASAGVEFTDEAAHQLVQDLSSVRVQRPGGGVVRVHGPYVEPFQLQVVCRDLWARLERERGDRLTAITLDDIKRSVGTDAQLGAYFATAVAEVARETGADELALRRWLETSLTTPDGFRSQTVSGPSIEGADPQAVIDGLQDAYLIRADVRGETTWYELAHDRLISVVLIDNAAWMRSRLPSWQLEAQDWGRDRDPSRLLQGAALRRALQAADTTPLTQIEQEFLRESARMARDGSASRFSALEVALAAVAALELIVIIVLLLAGT